MQLIKPDILTPRSMLCISRLVGVDCFHEGVVVYISEKAILFWVSVSSHVYADTSVISLVQYLNNQLFTLKILEGNLQQSDYIIACYGEVIRPPTRLVLRVWLSLTQETWAINIIFRTKFRHCAKIFVLWTDFMKVARLVCVCVCVCVNGTPVYAYNTVCWANK